MWILHAIWPVKVKRGFSLLSDSLLRFFLQQILADVPTDFVVTTMPVSSCVDKRENFNALASKDTI